MRAVVLVLGLLLLASPAAAQRRRGHADAGTDAGPRGSDAGVAAGGAADAGAASLERARALYVEGQAAYQAGRFDEASQRMAAAYELTHSPELAFNAGRAYERMSDYENARRFFQIYLRDGNLPPEERTALEARLTAIAEAETRRSQHVYTAPASTDELTTEARTFFLRGVAMFRRGQYQAAQTAFLAAYRFAPLAEVIYNMAVTAERLGATQDAIDYYREYIRARPDGPDRGDIEARVRQLRERR